MALTISMDGTLSLQLTDEARPTPVPVKFNLTYTKKMMYDFVNTTTVSHVAVPQGGVTAPRFILVFVREGEIELSWDSGGANPTVIQANPIQSPPDVPVMFLGPRHQPDAGQLYLTSAGVARGSIWIFE